MYWYLMVIQSLMLIGVIWTAYELHCIRTNKSVRVKKQDEDTYV